MATTLTDIRNGLVANLSTIANLQVLAYQMSNPTPPFALVFPGGPAGNIEYDLAMRRGLDRWPFTVQICVALGTDQGAQVNLDDYMEPAGARSVKQAIEANPTLSGKAQDVTVVSCSGAKQFVIGDANSVLLGAEWHVDVLAVGT